MQTVAVCHVSGKNIIFYSLFQIRPIQKEKDIFSRAFSKPSHAQPSCLLK